MANRTNTERIAMAEQEVIRLAADSRNLIARVHVLEDTLRAELGRLRDTVNEAVVRIAVLEQRCTHLETRTDEKDRRRWQVWLAFFGCVVTLLVQVIVVLIRK